MKSRPLLAPSIGSLALLLGALPLAAQQAGIPLHYQADKPGYVTLVAEDNAGNRIQNVAFDQPVKAGDNIITWDGSALTGLAAPGTYHVRGLFHEDITPHLQYSFYSPGTPPWPTDDGTGAWLADHTAPASALFLPGGSPWPAGNAKPVVLLGADSAEAGNALMWTDLNGRKLGGTKIRGWNGGIALARDLGPNPNPDHVAYTVFTDNPSRDFGKKDPGALEVYIITKTGLTPLAKVKGGIQVHDAFRELAGLAAYNGLLLLADSVGNELFAFDVRNPSHAPFATIPVSNLGGIAFEPNGNLLVASDGAIKRYTLQNDWKTLTLSGGDTVVASSDLQAPKQIIEQDGEIYVTDWGTSHQVKVFDAATGKLARTIGKPGGPQVGDYDEQRMAHPLGMTIDSNGTLWVAEEDYLPKRISRWNAKTGAFLNAWYGPTQYGGGGFVDPKDLSRVYYPSLGNPGSMGLLEFKVDLTTGQSKLTGVRYRYADPLNDIVSYAGYPTKPLFFPTDEIPPGSHGGIAPGQTFYLNGHQYFTDSYNGYWYNQGAATTLWILENGVARPIATCGWVGTGPNLWPTLNDPAIKAKIPKGRAWSVFYLWTDKHHDHAVHPEDIDFIVPPVAGRNGVTFQPDLSVISSGPYHLPATAIDDAGVPTYDLTQLKPFMSPEVHGDVALSPDGWFVADCSGYKDGQQRWSLATRDTRTPPIGPGDLESPDRMLGYPVKSARGDAGYMVARYSYMGEIYVYTVDGLLVTTLGADIRTAPFWPYPAQKLGMDITGLSFDAEHFWPFMFGLDDGNVYLNVGKWHSSIVRLDGLDSVKRIDLGNVQVTADMIAAAAPLRDAKVADAAIRDKVNVTSLHATIDGNLDEWPATNWAPINPKSSFQIGIDGDNLIVAYKTDQPQLLRDSATEFPFAFTQGGGLDLMLRTTGNDTDRTVRAGDLRLFVTQKDGKTLAVLYRQKATGHGNRATFASPIASVDFDDVQDISSDVQVAANGGNYEFSVPLSVLGLTNITGKTIRGDVGFVLSDGIRARARVYWHNKWDSMAADVPSEARLNPAQWGQIQF